VPHGAGARCLFFGLAALAPLTSTEPCTLRFALRLPPPRPYCPLPSHQVAAMYLPWPRSAIMLLPSCREQVDASGRLVFRGPRLKMGVCECPKAGPSGAWPEAMLTCRPSSLLLPLTHTVVPYTSLAQARVCPSPSCLTMRAGPTTMAR
jgi:hypothetical protein